LYIAVYDYFKYGYIDFMPYLIKNILRKITGPVKLGYLPDIEDRGRRRLFAIFMILLILPLLLFGTHLIRKGLYGYGIVDFIVALLFLIFLVIFNRINNAKVFYRFALSLLCFLLVYWVNTGAAKGYACMWVLTLPPFTFFLLGKREGSIWTVFIFGTTALFFFVPSLSVNGFVYEMDFITRHLFALFLIVLFTFSYESMREKYKNAMESEQQKLRSEKELLSEAKLKVDSMNKKLSEEMVIRRQAEDELRAHRDRLEELVAERTAELQKTNERLAASESSYRLMADNITDMIWTADLDLKFTFISPSVTRFFGYSVDEALELNFDKWNTPESFARVSQIYSEQLELEKTGNLDHGRYINVQLEHIRKDGTVVPVEVTVAFLRNADGEPIGLVGITRDISERISAEEEARKMEEQLAQAQKMEAIGTLVGGIAHDFNNILAGIIGSFDLLDRYLKDEKLEKRDKIRKYINLGMESSLRSAELVKQLVVLSRKHEISLTPIDISDPLNHVVEICRNSLPKNVEIDYKPAGSPYVIMGDIVQIEQVLLNLCINSSHSMTIMREKGGKQGGVLKIRVSEVKSDYIKRELCSEAIHYEGDWIKIEISDTGIGMDDETVKRIFEPFFSLKKQGEGSGLGLSISYNIIKQHRGFIHVYSEPGTGSRFSVCIPSYNNVEGFEPDRRTLDEISMGSGTILVIDDEPVLLNIAKGFLEESGYNVLTADTGDEGIMIYRENFDDIAGVLVDLSMPGKSGLEVYMELREINSEVKVLLASGMLDTDSLRTAEKTGIKGTVQKPYLASELSYKLKSVLSKQ